MISRRIATKTQSYFLFCSFRSTIHPPSAASSGSRYARTYISRNTSLRRPHGTAAAEHRDDDEGDTIEARQSPPSYNYRPQVARRQQRWDSSGGDRRTFETPGRSYDFNNRHDRRWQRPAAFDRDSPSFGRSSDSNARAYSRPFQQPADRASGPSRGSRFGSFVDDALAPGDQPRSFRSFRPTQEADLPEREGSIGGRFRNPQSRNTTSGFDAFSQAVRATESGRRQYDPPGGRNYERQGTQRDRNWPGARRGPPYQRSDGPFQRSQPSSRSGGYTQESAPDDGPNEAVDAIDNDVDEVDTSRRKKSSAKRASRSDRYADDDEDDFASRPTGKKDRRNKQRPERLDFEFEAKEEALEEELYGGESRQKKKQQRREAQKAAEQSNQRRMDIPEFISVQNMAQALGLRLEVFMDKLEEEGFEGARHDHMLDSGTSSMFAELYGYEPVLATAEAQQDLVARPPAPDQTILPPRPPIVTIMGHVDHGKTTILDYLRRANVVASEHGGITQHIGAFSVTMPGTKRQITFLDTPGHAAFLDMRRRGANVTDIVVLVVAADDSVKPQTVEAIKHALQANVQIIVAMNKVDKEDANVERVKQDLSRYDIIVEDFGGDYQAIPLSGKTGQGMDQLEEAIITLSDVSDFRAEVDGAAEGWIIESKITSAGRVATVLVRRGTLRPGDFIVAGNTWARVRTLRNDQGDVVSEAPPGTPVQIDGWRGEDPTAGLEVLQADNEQHAKDVVELRLEKAEALRDATDMAAINVARSEAAEARAKVVAWQSEQGFASRKQARVRLRDTTLGWVDAENDSGPRKVHFVVKADVAGSVEALVAAVSGIGNSDIQANIIHSGTGQLNESDIRMLATTGEVGYAISFNQPVDGTVYRLAEAAGLEILDHNVIYKVTDTVTDKIAAELPPLITTKVLGEAEVGQVFDVTIKKVVHRIAGCKITNGTISRSQKVRVIRGEETVYTGTLDSLKHVKKDVSEMRKGSECGMAFDHWEEMQPGDRVQCFEEISEKRKLY